jgi:hypothetical protein
MKGLTHPKPASAEETPRPATPDAEAEAKRLELLRKRQHDDAELDEALIESFPCSDPPASWAGA